MIFKIKIFLLLTIIFQCNSYSQSLKFGWTVPNAGSKVLSMKFMPDENFFICGTESSGLQIRKTEDGSLYKSYPEINGINDIEFTTDSTKIILAGATLQIRNLSDMSIVAIDSTFKNDNWNQYYFENIEVHPTLPIMFVSYTHYITNNPNDNTHNLVYNIQNLKKITELTDQNDVVNYLPILKISNDGKFIATTSNRYNAGSQPNPYLKIWSCETFQVINKYAISQNSTKPDGATAWLQFTQNSDILYFTGTYQFNNVGYSGYFKYSISQNKVIENSYKEKGLENVVDGVFTLFDKDKRIIIGNQVDGKIKILNIEQKKVESNIDIVNGYNLNNNILKSKNKYFFIGNDYYQISNVNFDTTKTGIFNNPDIITNLFPNPTNGNVNLQLNCLNQIHYQISNLNGIVLFNSSVIDNIQTNLIINFGQYPNGTYNLKVFCGNNVSTYRVVKI